jgi:hypothetical protein
MHLTTSQGSINAKLIRGFPRSNPPLLTSIALRDYKSLAKLRAHHADMKRRAMGRSTPFSALPLKNKFLEIRYAISANLWPS